MDQPLKGGLQPCLGVASGVHTKGIANVVRRTGGVATLNQPQSFLSRRLGKREVEFGKVSQDLVFSLPQNVRDVLSQQGLGSSDA